MKTTRTSLDGLLIIEPKVFHDERGWFMESFNERRFNEALEQNGQAIVRFVQDNHSMSHHGVLRGLHYQARPGAQGKLVRVTQGVVWDVAVDIRANSPTRGQWFGLELSAENALQLWIPEGFAHGFLTLSESAQLQYKTTSPYAVELDRGILWSDAQLGIDWPIMQLRCDVPVVNTKDAAAPCLSPCCFL